MKAKIIKTYDNDKIEYIIVLNNGLKAKVNINTLTTILKKFNKPEEIECYFGEDDILGKIPDQQVVFGLGMVEGEIMAYITNNNYLTIVNPKIFDILLEEQKMGVNYLGIKEYAEKVGKQTSTIRKMAAQGRLEGALFLNNSWIIPDSTPYVEDQRSVRWEKYREEKAKKELKKSKEFTMDTILEKTIDKESKQLEKEVKEYMMKK